jgi:hypothetical protein
MLSSLLGMSFPDLMLGSGAWRRLYPNTFPADAYDIPIGPFAFSYTRKPRWKV